MCMQSIRTFFYCLKQGIRSIFHNGMFSLASIGTIAASLFILGLFYFVTSNVSYVMKGAEQNVGVTVLFEEGCPEDKIEAIGVEIKKRAEVAKVEFISAEEAWENYKKDHLNEELAATFGEDNPLEDSASYKVYLNDVAMQEVLIRYIESLDGVRKVNALEGVAESLEGVNRMITLVSVAIIVILIAVAIHRYFHPEGRDFHYELNRSYRLFCTIPVRGGGRDVGNLRCIGADRNFTFDLRKGHRVPVRRI